MPTKRERSSPYYCYCYFYSPMPGGKIASKDDTPNIPRFEMAKVPELYSSGVSFF